MQFLTRTVPTLLRLPDATVNVNNRSPSASSTWSDNVDLVAVMMCWPARFVTNQLYSYAPDPPKANAVQLKRPWVSIWDGPVISNERDESGACVEAGAVIATGDSQPINSTAHVA
jgi:hypothetical protein